MKNVLGFIKNMSNSDLREACKEIQELHETTVLPEGKVREISKMISNEIGHVAVTSSLSLAESFISIEAMKRFIAITETLKINA